MLTACLSTTACCELCTCAPAHGALMLQSPVRRHEWDADGFCSFRQVVGDDLLVTNPKKVKQGIADKWCNALLLKVNQIGSLTEAIQVRLPCFYFCSCLTPYLLSSIPQEVPGRCSCRRRSSLLPCRRHQQMHRLQAPVAADGSRPGTDALPVRLPVNTGGAVGEGGRLGRHDQPPVRRDGGASSWVFTLHWCPRLSPQLRSSAGHDPACFGRCSEPAVQAGHFRLNKVCCPITCPSARWASLAT